MPNEVERVLAAWRRAEQRLAEVAEESLEYERARAEAERWRDRYQSLVTGSGFAEDDWARSQMGLPEAG